ncbi:TPA: hypothetical protein ACH3X1_005470 [Trebouxia sp. C0004]
MAVDVGNSSHSISAHQSQTVSHLHRDINRRIVDANSVVRVLDIVEDASQDFNAVNISTAFHRLARMWRDLPELSSNASGGQSRLHNALQTLMQLAVIHIKEVQGQGLGIIIWALAKICYDPVKIRSLLQAFAQEAIDRLTEGVPKNEPNLKLGPQSLSNMVYAYAVMGHHPGNDLLAAIAKGVQGQLRAFSPQGLSNTVWAYAKLGALPNTRPGSDESLGLEGRAKGNVGGLLDALAVEAVSQLMDARRSHKFIPQNLSNMVYGYAVLGHEPGAMLLLAVAQQALLQLDSFSPQELTNMVWAYAKLMPQGQPLFGPPQALLNAVPQHVVRQLGDDSQHHKVKPQTVSNLLWAYATLGWAPTHLLNSLAAETLRQLPYFKPQELANTLWAYATLGYTPMPDWLGQMGVACEGQVGGCKPQELSSLIWALGSLRHHPGAAFLRTATEAANRQLDKFKPGELCNFVWGVAQLTPQADVDLLQEVLQASATWSEGVGPVEVSRLLWGLAVLDELPKPAAAGLYDKLAQMPLTSFTAECLDQILQVDAFLECSVGSLMHRLPLQLQRALQLTLVNSLQQHHSSQMLLDTSAGLSALSVPHSAPYLMQDGPLLVDVAILGPCPAIALQIEDPGELAVNAPWLPLGNTRLKQQTIRSKGWQVVSIPFYIWNMLGTLPLRAAYLQQLLHICQAMQFQPTPYNSPTQPAAHSITARTFSNSGIERINSALAAQWSNPSAAAAAAHAGPGLGHMTADAAAAAGRAASCSRGPMTAGAAMMHQQLADSSRRLPEHVRNSALYQAYDSPSSTAPALTHESSLQSPFPQGFRHSSQEQALQAGLQYGQDGHSAAAAAASCHDVSPSTWDLGSSSSQSGTVHHQSRLFEADLSKSDSQQSRTVHDRWAGQRQGMPGGDPPLDAAQYDAVAALQSLALQLQATGLQSRQTDTLERMCATSAARGAPPSHLTHPAHRDATVGIARLAPSLALSVSTSGEDCRPDSSHDPFASWQDATPNTGAPPPLSLSAHRPPWDVYQAQQDSISNQGVPCVVLQAAGYAPTYAHRDRR